MTIKDLQERKNEVGTKLEALIKELAPLSQRNEVWPAEKDAEYERLSKEYDSFEPLIQKERQAQANLEERLNRIQAEREKPHGQNPNPNPGREDFSERSNPESSRDPAEVARYREERAAYALQAWATRGKSLRNDKRAAAAVKSSGVNYRDKELWIGLPGTKKYRDLQRAVASECRKENPNFDSVLESRAMSAYTGATGAHMVPPANFVQSLEVNMLWYGGIRQVAETIVTSGGETLVWPTADDTSNTGEQVGENTSVDGSTDPAFAAKTWGAWKFSSKMIKVPYELMEDSAFDVASILGQMMGERLGRFTNTRYTTGTGANTAYGIVTRSSLGVTSASATAITFAELLALTHSVDKAYRDGGQFMFHDDILLYLRKQVDANGNMIWQRSTREGAPDTLHGHTYVINSAMTGATNSLPVTATKHVLFGKLNAYKIRRVNGMRMLRLSERYADTDQQAFISFIREDGNLLDAGTVPVKHLLQA